MKQKFDIVSLNCSKYTTKYYSTSFSLGILFLDKEFRDSIYSIYGFVRFADEIVDSFHDYNRRYLLEKFRADTYDALENKISLNPILNCFQQTVHQAKIDQQLIDLFLDSMAMDLERVEYNSSTYDRYILGSAEVVGLMCLKVFVKGDARLYEKLKPSAMKLGAAFQKVNFLRDIKYDHDDLGRMYFPGVDISNFTTHEKRQIEGEIINDFQEALAGIKQLSTGSRRGVYLAYFYYKKLFDRIRYTPANDIMKKRIRIPNGYKFLFMVNSYIRHQTNML